MGEEPDYDNMSEEELQAELDKLMGQGQEAQKPAGKRPGNKAI
jgi:hypothetical protein